MKPRPQRRVRRVDKKYSGVTHEDHIKMAEAPHPLRIFLCHSSGDKQSVRDLYKRLRADGFNPWLDEENLLPGQDWQRKIPEAVRAADVVIVCLSRSSISKKGYVQKEIGYALDVADEQPEGMIYLVPLKLEECEMPERLRRWHWVSLFEPAGYERLLNALRHRAASLPANLNISSLPSSAVDATPHAPGKHDLSQETEGEPGSIEVANERPEEIQIQDVPSERPPDKLTLKFPKGYSELSTPARRQAIINKLNKVRRAALLNWRAWAYVAAATSIIIVAFVSINTRKDPSPPENVSSPSPGTYVAVRPTAVNLDALLINIDVKRAMREAERFRRDILGIKEKLARRGLYGGEINDVIDRELIAAVVLFQSENGLRVDGVPGPKTFKELGYDMEDAVNKTSLLSQRLGINIRLAKEKLAGVGLYEGEINDVIDRELITSVLRFQRERGFDGDGVLGPHTFLLLLNNK